MSAITSYQTLTAGLATFTLSGTRKSGGEARWTYQIDRTDREGGDPIYFAKYLGGADNDGDYYYMGVYQPETGGLRLTKASKVLETSEVVRGFNWATRLMVTGQEDQIEAAGFRIQWADKCQRCGRTLTVPSSIDARFGPDCAKKILEC